MTGMSRPAYAERPLGTQRRGLGLQQVLGGLDQDRVDAAGQHPLDLGLIGIPERGEPDVPERRQLGTRADTAQHPAGPVGRAVRVGRLPGDPGRGLGQVVDLIGDAVLAQGGQVGAEGVGLHRVHPDLEVGVVDGSDHVWAGPVEDLVAALELVEVGQVQIEALQHRAHCSVRNHQTAGQG